MVVALHGQDGLTSLAAVARAFEFGGLLNHGQRRVEALVAEDGRDVLQAGHRVAELVAGQPVHCPRRLNGREGLPALQSDHVEIGQLELRDEVLPWANLYVGFCSAFCSVQGGAGP